MIVLLFVRAGVPVIAQYVDPVAVAEHLAGHPLLTSPLPSVLALGLLALGLGLGVRAVLRRDAS